MKYILKTFREAGLEAKWNKTAEGEKFITVRKPKEKTWWVCDRQMFKTMHREGVMQGFETHTVLGDIFSIGVPRNKKLTQYVPKERSEFKEIKLR